MRRSLPSSAFITSFSSFFGSYGFSVRRLVCPLFSSTAVWCPVPPRSWNHDDYQQNRHVRTHRTETLLRLGTRD